MLCEGYASRGEDKTQQRAQLVMLKAGLVEPWKGNESSRIGQLMEEHLFAPMAKELLGWELEPCGQLIEDALCASLAATPDFFVRTPYGLAVVQTKDTTASAQEDCKPRRDGSASEAAYANGPPLYYALQLQAELACTGLEWGALLVLHAANGGKKLRAYATRRHEAVIARLRAEAPKVLADAMTLKAGQIERVA